MVTKMNCACAVGRASATSCGMPLAAPISGSVAWVSASINANCPISGSIMEFAGLTALFSLFAYKESGVKPPHIKSLFERLGCFVRGVLYLINVPALFQGLGRFGRHVVLVMLGHNLVCVKHAVRTNLTLGHTPAPFLKKVGENPFIDYGNRIRSVGHGEMNREPVVIALESAILHQSADTKRAPDRRFLRSDLRGTKEENEIVLKSGEHQPGRQAQRCQTTPDKNESFMTTFH